MSKFKHGTPEYWRDWYWHRGGREKVQYSRKVTQRLQWELNHRKRKENDTQSSNQGQ